jgi:hypothetical protein
VPWISYGNTSLDLMLAAPTGPSRRSMVERLGARLEAPEMPAGNQLDLERAP